MRRILIVSGLTLVILMGVVTLGLLLTSRVLPDQVRQIVGAQFSAALETPVSVRAAELQLGWGLTVVATELSAWKGPDQPALRVPRATMGIDLIPLLAGKIQVRSVRLEEPHLALTRSAEGRITAPFSWPSDSDEPGPDQIPLAKTIAAALTSILQLPLAAPRVEVVDGVLTLLGSDASSPSIEAHRVMVRARRNAAGSTTVVAEIDLLEAGRALGRLEASLRTTTDDLPVLRVEFARLDLASLSRHVPSGLRLSSIRGLATGRIDLGVDAADGLEGDVRLRVSRFALRLPREQREPVLVESDPLGLTGELRVTAAGLELSGVDVDIGGVQLQLQGALELPARETSQLRLVVETPLLPLASLAGALAWAPERTGERWLLALRRVEAGRFRDVELRIETTLRGFQNDPIVAGWPALQDLELRGIVEAAAIDLEGGDRLEGLRAEVRFGNNTLEVARARAQLNGTSLPELELSVAGVSHLMPTEGLDCQRPEEREPIQGAVALRRWVEGRREPGGTRTWTQLDVEADWIRHPALLCSVENLRATLTPTDDGWTVVVHQATWAGAPVRATGRIPGRLSEALSLTVSVGPAWEPVSLDQDGGPWAAGRFVFHSQRFGPWRIRGARGAFELEGSALQLRNARLELVPEGEVRGDLRLDLGDPEAVAYRTEFTIENGSVARLAESLDRDGALVKGTLNAAGTLRGVLRGIESPFAQASGTATMMARNGELHRRIPAIVAIAMASEALSPVRNREVIPYEGIDAVLQLEDGVLTTSSLSVYGPWLRAVVSGQVDLVDRKHPMESVIGLFFFRNLDSIISKLPILNRLLLGKDESLINAYFALSGPFGKPKARFIPVKTLASGPASFVLEGFPAFVRGSLNRLLSVLAPGVATSEMTPEPRELLGS